MITFIKIFRQVFLNMQNCDTMKESILYIPASNEPGAVPARAFGECRGFDLTMR